jgi:hypothetical protein
MQGTLLWPVISSAKEVTRESEKKKNGGPKAAVFVSSVPKLTGTA